MDANEFAKKLELVQELMAQEKYEDALQLLDELKKIEKESDYNYSLTHKLYQLDSNTRSLNNQKIIMKRLNLLTKDKTPFTLKDFQIKLEEIDNLHLDVPIIRREIEILILRGLITIKIDEDQLVP